MPENAPSVKKDAVAGYGAEITFCKPTTRAREETCKAIMESTGRHSFIPTIISMVICGRNSFLELLAEINDLDAVIAPVGGGGLIAEPRHARKGST